MPATTKAKKPRIPKALRERNKKRGERAAWFAHLHVGGAEPDEANIRDLLTDLLHHLGPEAFDTELVSARNAYHCEAIEPDDIAIVTMNDPYPND